MDSLVSRVGLPVPGPERGSESRPDNRVVGAEGVTPLAGLERAERLEGTPKEAMFSARVMAFWRHESASTFLYPVWGWRGQWGSASAFQRPSSL